MFQGSGTTIMDSPLNLHSAWAIRLESIHHQVVGGTERSSFCFSSLLYTTTCCLSLVCFPGAKSPFFLYSINPFSVIH